MHERDPLGLVGQTVRDTWEVTDLVHHGGLSLVYRAVRTFDGMRAAIKCYTCLADVPDRMQSTMRDVFIRVGKTVGRLAPRHPGLVRPIGGGWLPLASGSEIPCIILEWLRGHTLEALLDREPLGLRRTADEVLSLMADPIAALAAAHEHGLVHRDIKPSNFFVCGDSLAAGASIKVLDLNLAKLGSGEEDSLPRPSVLFMTPHYAAPEQFLRDDALIGPWTDVYGLALVLLELMTGEGPVQRGDSIDDLRRAARDPDDRPTPRRLGLDTDNAVEAVFKRALAVEPRERFRTIGAFSAALESAIEADGRVTSSAISRVFGVLECDTPAEPTRTQPMPIVRPSTGTVISGAPPPAPVTGDTVIAPSPVVTGYTVLAPLPSED